MPAILQTYYLDDLMNELEPHHLSFPLLGSRHLNFNILWQGPSMGCRVERDAPRGAPAPSSNRTCRFPAYGFPYVNTMDPMVKKSFSRYAPCPWSMQPNTSLAALSPRFPWADFHSCLYTAYYTISEVLTVIGCGREY